MERFRQYLNAVGTGPKGNRDLTIEEAQDAMTMILNREIPKEMIAAFILGFRLKPETIEEYIGCLQAFDLKIKKSPVENSIELGFPFDGKNKSPYFFPLTAKYLAPFGINLVVTSDLKIPSKDGVIVKDVAERMDFPSNVFYFDRKNYLKSLHDLTEIRNILGFRSAFNTLEKMSGVGESRYAMTGVFHKPYVQKYLDIFANRLDNFFLISSNEGTPEIFNPAKVWYKENNQVLELIINPKEYGIDLNYRDEELNVFDSIRICEDPTQEEKKLAKLNAALCLWLSKKADSFKNGLELLDF